MTDNMFDKFVRDKLGDHQSPVPPGLWEKIERKKDKDPKGGFFLPRLALWAGALIIASGIGIGYYVSRNNDTAAISTQQNETATQTTVAANDNGGVNNTNRSINAPTSTTAGANDDGGNNKIKTNNTNNNNSNTKNNSNPVATTNNDGKNISNDNNTINDDSRNNNSANTNAVVTPINKNKRNTSSGKTDVVRSNNYLGTNNSNVVFSGRRKNTSKNKTGSKTNTSITATTDVITQDEILAMIKADENRIAFTPGKTAYRLKNFNDLSSHNYDLSSFKLVGIDCPTAGFIRRNDWYLEIYGSPDIVMKSVKANNSTVASKKDSTESQQLSYTAGFRISKSIGENLLLKTGLQYSQINERFDLRTENERRIITVVTIRTVTGSSGADSTISDTSTVEQIGYRLQRTYNRYRSIDIPLLISYEFGNENLKFALNAGAIVNLYSWYKGNTINDSGNVVSMNSKASGVYKTNIGVGLYAGFSVMKPISKKFDVFLEPYFRYNFSNMTRSAGYTQRFNAMGINLGLRYKLKGRQRSETN